MLDNNELPQWRESILRDRFYGFAVAIVFADGAQTIRGEYFKEMTPRQIMLLALAMPPVKNVLLNGETGEVTPAKRSLHRRGSQAGARNVPGGVQLTGNSAHHIYIDDNSEDLVDTW